ncbi:MAG: phage tail protein [Alphaproteobacteria bacterium HGW-Alphaproteobacteria-13]|nr:MAG: phage tail protein [Alphaproteobacteria bacterium HGW-Alphaproteobacteria-13]
MADATPLTRAPAIAGETLDALCWRALGSVDAVEEVIALNPRLTGVTLAEGTVVILPVRVTATSPRMIETVQLWS